MENVFNLHRGSIWLLKDFCDMLHATYTNSSQFGIASIQHRKRLYNDFQHEFIVLDVVPFIAGTSAPDPAGPHTYIEIGRVSDEARISFFGLWGFAFDEVIVLRQEDEARILAPASQDPSQDFQSRAGERLATLSWPDGIPNLVDVFSLITQLAVTFPYYNILTHQCFWLVRAIYDTLRFGYSPFLEDTGSKFRKKARFLVRLVTPRPPPAILEICNRQRRWRQLNDLGL